MAQRRPARRRRSRLPDWSSGLPQELLESIVKRVPSGRDAAAFRSVCTRWRAALPFASFAPLLLLPFDPALPEGAVTFYSLADESALSKNLPRVRGKALCGSSRGWLALADEAASVTLLNPFTGATVELPPVDERVVAASSRCVSMIDGRWVLIRPDVNGHGHAAGDAVKLDDMRDVFFREIVLSSPPRSNAGGGRDGCVAMAVLANSTEVAFCRVGDSAWTLLDTNLECCVSSILHCQDRFLAIGCLGEISICDITAGATTPTATPMPSLTPPTQLCHRSYLQANGELHLVGAVVRASHKARRFTYRVAVYKCDLVAGTTPAWSRVKDAGDMALFVSKHFKATFSGASVSGLIKRNSVYFSEPLYGYQEDPDYCLEIADIATGTSELVPYHRKMQGSEALCWIQPNLWVEGGWTNARKVKDHKGNTSQPDV